ncbi:hypothetical protein Tsubulata_004422 [Turnera subulata]|uniref:AB hydrolase-1 domain-containing protein n=1 Tax=Turnera subulata TaxID=218843 RepID=A0A9Q0GFL3_9ROSI|nr:hypothetical protein Tsubulata_004422 [Turnera subulata]
MAMCCLSFTVLQNSWYQYSFTRGGLRSSTTDLGDGTVVHCWVPKAHAPSKPTLVLIHGFGANAMWQFSHLISLLAPKFNLYVPDLLFFGGSHTSRPERTEAFQAQCVMGLMEPHMKAHGVARLDLFGLSYGGFVAYSMAAQYKERVGRVVLGCAGVCFEEKDMEEGGLLRVRSVEEAVSILLPETPEKCRELVRMSFYKPPPKMPSCFLRDFIQFIILSLMLNNIITNAVKRIAGGRGLTTPRLMENWKWNGMSFGALSKLD